MFSLCTTIEILLIKVSDIKFIDLRKQVIRNPLLILRQNYLVSFGKISK